MGQDVTIRENGEERVVTAAQALLLKLTQQGLKHGGSIAQQLAEVLESQRKLQGPEIEDILLVRVHGIAPGAVNDALEDLRMGWTRDRKRPSAKMFLEPWIVERALIRMGDKRLTIEEQTEVVKATRMPKKVKWPDWWQVLPGE